MNGSLQDRVVLVTGALGTIGQAICTAIERERGSALRSDPVSYTHLRAHET